MTEIFKTVILNLVSQQLRYLHGVGTSKNVKKLVFQVRCADSVMKQHLEDTVCYFSPFLEVFLNIYCVDKLKKPSKQTKPPQTNDSL